MDQTLYGDEYITHTIVTENDLGGVWDQVYNTSITPPLHYVLAWLSTQFGGDSTVLVRLPSLIFGTALVPVVYLIGTRLGGVWVGLVAALLIALSPHAIWYSDEARNYATMMFAVALSTLALLRALDGGNRRWWALYALAGCAALWSHYTAVFVLIAQAGWALWSFRDRFQEIAIATAGIGLGYLPWLPGFLEQRQNEAGIDIIDTYAPLHFDRVFIVPVRTLIGHPELWLKDSPGQRGLLLVVFLLLLAVGAAARKRGAFRQLVGSLPAGTGLMTIMAIATPIGLLLYAATGPSLFLARNLSASLPALAVLVALLTVSLAAAAPPRLAALAGIGLIGVLGFDAVDTVADDAQRRPPYREAAHYLDDVARPSDVVVERPIRVVKAARFPSTTLNLYSRRTHRVYPPATEGAAWRLAEEGRALYLVAPRLKSAASSPRATARQVPPGLLRRIELLGGPDGRTFLLGKREFPGMLPVVVYRYGGTVDGTLRRRGDREVISWSLGKRVVVSPGAVRGEVDLVTAPGKPLLIGGWALQAAKALPADWILFFYGDRLIATSAGGFPRPDQERLHGPSALLSGFARSPLDPPRDRSGIRVFAVVGGRASELPRTGAARPAR